MLRRERLGCLLLFFMPFFALAGLLLWKALEGLAKGLARDALAELGRVRSFEDLVVSQSLEGCGAFVLFLLGAVLLAGLPVVTIRYYLGRKPDPEPAAHLVSPVPGASPPELPEGADRPSGPAPQPGSVGQTRLLIEVWRPGWRLSVRENSRSRIPAALSLTAGLVFLFVLLPSFEPESFEIAHLRLGLPPIGHLLVDPWLLAMVFFTLKPSPARALTIDWQTDAVAVSRGGKLRRLLGLSRLRAIEHREAAMGYVNADTTTPTPRQVSYRQQLIAWIEPEGREPVAYLLVESRAKRHEGAKADRKVVATLAAQLAASLGVSTSRPREVVDEEIYR